MSTIKLDNFTFTVSDPFIPGEPISPEAARVFNTYRAETIRKNLIRKWQDFISSPALLGKTPTKDQLEEFQVLVTQYDADYPLGKNSRNSKPGAIETEARRIAEARLPSGAPKAMIESLARTHPILSEARERIAKKAAIIALGISDL